MIFNPIIGGGKLPTLSNPGSENDLLEGKQLIDEFGNPLTGTIPIKTETDISVNGHNIIIPSGYYDSQVSKSVETTTQSTPSINVSSSGLITASSVQDEGYVYAGTKSSTQQLPTQSGTTITPGTTQKVAVTSGKYTTGDINVAGSANLVANNIKSGINIFGVTGNYDGKSIKYIENGVSISVSNPSIMSLTFTLNLGTTITKLDDFIQFNATGFYQINNVGTNYGFYIGGVIHYNNAYGEGWHIYGIGEGTARVQSLPMVPGSIQLTSTNPGIISITGLGPGFYTYLNATLTSFSPISIGASILV